MFRSDSLAHAAPDDVVHLVEERGVRTVVDLRGAAEVDAFPNQPMADAGVTIHHVPLIDPEKREQSGLDWETMTLVDLYRFLLESAGAEFVEVLQIIAEPANHPLVFHCAAGKDRAGLIAATVLGLLEVDDEEIVADYAATEAALEALKERAAKRADRHRSPTGGALHDRRGADRCARRSRGCTPSTAGSSRTCSGTASARASSACCGRR